MALAHGLPHNAANVPSAFVRRVAPLAALAPWLISIACTVEGKDGATSFGETLPNTTTPTTMTTTVASTMTGAAGSSDSGGETGSETAVGGSTAPATSGDSSGAVDTAPTTGGEQPEDGMYSACETAAQCFGLTNCLVVQVDDAFCTNTGCTDATVDCMPSPGGTATPACVMAQIEGNPQQVCALDCSGGRTCPSPMQCLTLVGQMICA